MSHLRFHLELRNWSLIKKVGPGQKEKRKKRSTQFNSDIFSQFVLLIYYVTLRHTWEYTYIRIFYNDLFQYSVYLFYKYLNHLLFDLYLNVSIFATFLFSSVSTRGSARYLWASGRQTTWPPSVRCSFCKVGSPLQAVKVSAEKTHKQAWRDRSALQWAAAKNRAGERRGHSPR